MRCRGILVKRNPLILVFVAAVALTMLFVAIHTARKTHVAGVSGQVQGQIAPDFELQSLEGQNIKLSSYRGKAVLLRA